MNKATYQSMLRSVLEAGRRYRTESNESKRFRGRGVDLHQHYEFQCKANSLAIFNESNLLGCDNIGGAANANVQDGNRSETPSVAKDGDDNGGDPDPEPERKTRGRKKKIFTGLPREGYVRLWQILEVIPVSKSTWWAGCKSGRFPSPKKLGPRTTVWRVPDIRLLIDDWRGE